MLTEQEIWQAIEYVPITQAYVVSVARAIEAKVLARLADAAGGCDLVDIVNAVDRAIQGEQARVDAARAAHPDDLYLGLMQMEDIELLRAAIQRLTGPTGVKVRDGGQPVAWRVRGYNQFKTGTPRPWRYFDGAERPKVNNPEDCDFEPLFSDGVDVPAAPLPLAGLSPWLRSVASTMVEGEDRQAILRWSQEVDTVRGVPDGVPVVHDCPTCAHRDSPGAKGPCKSCSVLWKPENGGCEDNWTPIPAGVDVPAEGQQEPCTHPDCNCKTLPNGLPYCEGAARACGVKVLPGGQP